MGSQDEVYKLSLEGKHEFWEIQAESLEWLKKPEGLAVVQQPRRVDPYESCGTEILGKLDDETGLWEHAPQRIGSESYLKQKPSAIHANDEYMCWEWFDKGKLSICYNCVDRHAKCKEKRDNVAIFYDNPLTQVKQSWTYGQLHDQVAITAGVLKMLKVRQYDIVLLFMPMIPQTIFAMLGASRLGAVHFVVDQRMDMTIQELADLIEDSHAVGLLTTSCEVLSNGAIWSYENMVKRALMEAEKHQVKFTLVWQQQRFKWKMRWNGDCDMRDWQRTAQTVRYHDFAVDKCKPMDSSEALYIVRTKGTTGRCKQVMRDVGGYATSLQLSMKYHHGIHSAGMRVFATSSIGTELGHSMLVYGPLLMGATTMLYGGNSVTTPNAGSYWRLIKEYSINKLVTTAADLRTIYEADEEFKVLAKRADEWRFQTLDTIMIHGKELDEELQKKFKRIIGRYGGKGVHIVPSSWLWTESGIPMAGYALMPRHGWLHLGDLPTHPNQVPPGERAEIRRGSAGKPMPGFDVYVVDDEGEVLPSGRRGNLVLSMPPPPPICRTHCWDEARFYSCYLKRFRSRWFDTGDWGMMDEDGYVYVEARSDDPGDDVPSPLALGLERYLNLHPLVVQTCLVTIKAPNGPRNMLLVTLCDQVGARLFSHGQLLGELRTAAGRVELGGIVCGRRLIPLTRSCDMARRVVRQLFEQIWLGQPEAQVDVPSQVDARHVERARRLMLQHYNYLQQNPHQHRPYSLIQDQFA
ncbi:hypothetical protein CDD81_5290 [Ophiocordyceps australis]|uniref:AMP-dependent synthetase/ligase domain-containing protein n=1 Tax=Ophiocordyceps australis TaxID=1399860 RepID=A0A2C5XME2_9HYPO|nr:hypothetical protein CDD81_5290 [Ophiocordyceps australis]